MQCWLLGSNHEGWAMLTVPGSLVLGGWDVSNLTVKPGGVVPGDPLDDRPLELRLGAPRSMQGNEFGLERAVQCFGHRVVVGVPDAADRRSDASLGEPLAVAEAGVLGPGVAVVHERAGSGVTAPDRHLQGVEHDVGP